MLKQLAFTISGATLITMFIDVNSVQGMNWINNGSFELGQDPAAGNIFLTAGSTAITDWFINTGTIDYIGGTWVASDGDRSVDLSGNNAGEIQHTFETIVGETYTVSFDLAGNPLAGPNIKSMTVSAAGDSEDFTFDTTGQSTLNMGWETNTWMFTAINSTTTLSFASNNDGIAGPALDHVSLTANTSVPEPSSIMGLGILTTLCIGTGFKRKLGQAKKK